MVYKYGSNDSHTTPTRITGRTSALLLIHACILAVLFVLVCVVDAWFFGIAVVVGGVLVSSRS